MACVGLLISGCNLRQDFKTGGAPARKAATLGAVPLAKPMDEETNPYRGLYREWDVWAFSHLTQTSICQRGGSESVEDWVYREIEQQGERPSTFVSFRVLVDGAGYLIPVLETTKLYEEAVGDGSLDEFANSPLWLYAEGPMDGNLQAIMFNANQQTASTFYRPIPGWLAKAPPKSAILLPNGETITEGGLGSWRGPGGCAPCEESCPMYQRYSKDGELLGEASGLWWFLYYDVKTKGMPPGRIDITPDGYVYIKDRKSGKPLKVYDYDGRELSESEVTPRDQHGFMTLDGGVLRRYYELAQNI